MLRGAQRYAPAGHFQIARVETLLQQYGHALMTDNAPAVFREQRIVLQEAHHVGLRLEAPAGKAFEGFLHHRGDRFVAHQYLAAFFDSYIF